MDKQQVLSGNIDGKIVDYVEEVMRVHNIETTASAHPAANGEVTGGEGATRNATARGRP